MWVEEASEVDIEHITRFFTNQQYDKESGLYYMNARYYDPHLGSFITPDPAMANLNHYAYASANPIKYTDPTGLDDESQGAAGAATAGGSAAGGAAAAAGVEGSNDDDYDPYGDTGYPIEYDYGEMTPGMDEGHPVEYDYGEFTPGMDPGPDFSIVGDYVVGHGFITSIDDFIAGLSSKESGGKGGSGKSSGSGAKDGGKSSGKGVKEEEKSPSKNEKEISTIAGKAKGNGKNKSSEFAKGASIAYLETLSKIFSLGISSLFHGKFDKFASKNDMRQLGYDKYKQIEHITVQLTLLAYGLGSALKSGPQITDGLNLAKSTISQDRMSFYTGLLNGGHDGFAPLPGYNPPSNPVGHIGYFTGYVAGLFAGKFITK